MTVNSYTYTEGLGGGAESEYTQPTQSNETKTFAEEMNDTKKSDTTDDTQTKSTSQEEKPGKAEKVEEEVDLWALFEDIKSLMKTGLTKDELELIDKLKKAIFDEASKENPDQTKLEDMISELEKAIAALKKKVTGEAIVEAEDNPITHSSSSLTTSKKDSTTAINFEGSEKLTQSQMQRISDALNTFEELVSGKEKKDNMVNNTISNISKSNYSNEEFELLNRIKNFQQ